MLQKGKADHRVDIYSLGCVAYWMLTGQRVFEGETPLAVLMSHANSEPTPMSERTEQRIPAGLEAVVLGCLAKDPGDRPPGAAALAERLTACEELSSWSREKALRWWRAHLPDRMAMHRACDLRNDRARQ